MENGAEKISVGIRGPGAIAAATAGFPNNSAAAAAGSQGRIYPHGQPLLALLSSPPPHLLLAFSSTRDVVDANSCRPKQCWPASQPAMESTHFGMPSPALIFIHSRLLPPHSQIKRMNGDDIHSSRVMKKKVGRKKSGREKRIGIGERMAHQRLAAFFCCSRPSASGLQFAPNLRTKE